MKKSNLVSLFAILSFIVFSLISCNNNKKEFPIEVIPFTNWFKIGEPVPLELVNLHFEPNDSVGRYYLAELKALDETSWEITLKELDSNYGEFMRVVINSNGNPRLEKKSDSEEINNFILNKYTAWCGDWHRGRKNYWQICGGKSDCGCGCLCIKKWSRSCEDYIGGGMCPPVN
jgi:hypothetical protein